MAIRAGFHWSSKPLLGAQLDVAHPLAASLLAGYLFNENGSSILNDLNDEYNLVSAPTATPSKWPTWQGGVTGPQAVYLASNTNSHQNTLINLPTTTCTILLIFNPQTPATNHTFFGSFSGLANNRIGLSWSGTLYFWEFGGTGSGPKTVMDTDRLGQHDHEYLGLGAGPLGTSIWVNSQKVATQSISAALRVNSTAGLSIGRAQGLGLNSSSAVEAFFCWNAELSDDQMRQVSAEPYQMILPPTTRRWFVPAAAAAFAGAEEDGILYEPLGW